MKMRIYSKKAYALGPGAKPHSDTIEQIVTVPNAFQDIPDEYANDTMFKMALKSGNITIIERKPAVPVEYTEPVKEEIVETEKEPDEEFEDVKEPEVIVEAVKEEVKEDVDPYAEFKNKLTLAKSDEVRKLAEEYGAEFIEDAKLKENKKRVYEAYKIKLADSAE